MVVPAQSQQARPVPEVSAIGGGDVAGDFINFLTAKLPEIAQEFAAARPAAGAYGDWVSAFVEGDAIGTDEAAFIAGCSAQKIRRQATEAAATDKPLGVWFAQSVWLVSKTRLIDAIEERKGRPERLAAMSRAAKYAEMRPPQQNSNILDAPQQAEG